MQKRSVSRTWLSNLAQITTQGAMESGSLKPSAGKGCVEEESSECHSQVDTEQGPLLAPGMTQCPTPARGHNQCSADRTMAAQHRCVVNRGQGWKGLSGPREVWGTKPHHHLSSLPSQVSHPLAGYRQIYLSENSHRKLRSFFFSVLTAEKMAIFPISKGRVSSHYTKAPKQLWNHRKNKARDRWTPG